MLQQFRTSTFIIAALCLFLLPASNGFANGDDALGISLPVLKGNYDIAVANLGVLNARGRTTSLVKLPSDAEIVAAYVYGSGYSDLTRDQLGDIILNFKNKTDNSTASAAASLIGYAEIDGKNYFTYRADVTKAVAAGIKTYRLNGFTLPATPQQGGGFFGVGLVVIYAKDSFPQSQIILADGLDYINAAAGQATSEVASFNFPALGFTQAASVKLFAAKTTSGGTQQWFNGSENSSAAADAVWSQAGSGAAPQTSIMDAAGAVDYENSSNADPAIDTDPLADMMTRSWATLEFSVPISEKDSWVALQIESQQDKPDAAPFDGVWMMAATKITLEDVGCGAIGDQVFYDRDGDGLQGDRRERGVPGVTVRLYADNGDGVLNTASDALVDTMLTNDLGFYEFSYLDPGVYFVEIDHERMDPQYVYFTNISNPTDAIVLDSCEPNMDVDFGLNVSGLPGGGQGGGQFGGGNGGGFNFGGGNGGQRRRI